MFKFCLLKKWKILFLFFSQTSQQVLDYFKVNLLLDEFEQQTRPATLFKKRLWHRCFPVNFAKFLRALLEDCFWTEINNLNNETFAIPTMNSKCQHVTLTRWFLGTQWIIWVLFAKSFKTIHREVFLMQK